jgi:hypothetical protein
MQGYSGAKCRGSQKSSRCLRSRRQSLTTTAAARGTPASPVPWGLPGLAWPGLPLANPGHTCRTTRRTRPATARRAAARRRRLAAASHRHQSRGAAQQRNQPAAQLPRLPRVQRAGRRCGEGLRREGEDAT